MENYLKKVEIGCGSTKTEGYIGVDRFPLPGVDLIADLNHERLPFEDSSVDVIYACHSLEHLDSLEQIIFEIYRVCKHGSIVMILAPYWATSLNLANPFHKAVFNEETFRFFSSNLTQRIIPREYACPHAPKWGLGESDNSEKKMELEILSIEFFYYQEFRHMSAIEKLHARKSLTNVCDQIYYVLAVNKSSAPYTQEELEILYQQAQPLEPALISSLRERDQEWQYEDSIFTDITQSVFKQQQDYIEKQLAALTQKQDSISAHTLELLKATDITQSVFKQQQDYIEKQIAALTQKQDSISAHTLELLKATENKSSISRKFSVYHKSVDFFPAIMQNERIFTDGLILACSGFGPKSILTLSKTVPYESYFEFQLNGYGNRIHFFLIANVGAKLFVEVIQNGKIVKQEHMTIDREGHHSIEVDSIKGRVSIRFKSMDNKSIIRVLEIGNRCCFVLAKKSIAAFVD